MKKLLLLLLAVLVIAAAIFIVSWFIDYRADQAILEQIRNIDYLGVEIQVTEKIADLVKQTSAEPGMADNWGRLGENLYIHDFKAISVACFSKAYTLNKGDFRWPYFCAVALDELNSEQAIEWYEIAKNLKADYPPLMIKLGDKFLLTGRSGPAADCFTSVVNSGLPVPHAHLGLARIAMDAGDLKSAEEELNKAIAMAPIYREARALLADVYRRQGNKPKAEAAFKVLTRMPERLDLNDPVYYQMVEEGVSSFWYQVRGNNFLNKGDLNHAEDEFKKALAAKPNEASHTSLGYVFQRQKRYEAAMDHYEQALTINPNHNGALNNMAVIYYELGDLNKANQAIERALKADPESADSWLNLGTFQKQQKKRREAINSFRRGLELAPGDMRFVYQLAWLLATAPDSGLRNGAEALEFAQMLSEYAGVSPASLDVLAAAQAEAGQYKEAMQTAQKAYGLALKSRNSHLAQEIKRRFDRYKTNMPYREK